MKDETKFHERLAKLVEDEIRGYRCKNAVDEEGQGLQLLDVIGAEEVDALVDVVVVEVMSLNILHLSAADFKTKQERLAEISVLDDHLDEPGEAEGGYPGLLKEIRATSAAFNALHNATKEVSR